MNNTPIFLMPVKLRGTDLELKHFRESVESIKKQTDGNWLLVMVDDYSENQKVYDVINEIKEDLKDKLHVIYSDRNYGAGEARNKGVRYAHEIGAPFIVFNDSDDLSDPRRLELVRKEFDKDPSVNVVYTSFNVIDENDNIVPLDKVTPSVREIMEGHKVDIVEGENAWISIAMKKKYTNLTSCTAVRTDIAYSEPFPHTSVSEDCHTWFRYAAHPGKYVFNRDIKGGYRICTGVGSRSRGLNPDFYEKMFRTDLDGFESAVVLAKKYGTMGNYNEDDIRCGFYVRIALTLLHGDTEDYCQKALNEANKISKQKTQEYIDVLPCDDDTKAILKSMIE